MKKQMKYMFLAGGIIFGVFNHTILYADDDDFEKGFNFFQNTQDRQSYQLYKNECGSCHVAFPAKFMSSDTWQKIMSRLEDHYGDNAELDADPLKQISQYLLNNAGRWRTWENSKTLRITDSRKFMREHDEVPRSTVGPNAKVKSYTDCAACHQNAANAAFNERDIRIPGLANWDDD